MEITTKPVCRFGWQGQTLHYVVKADGAAEVRVPDGCPEGFDARITGTRRTDDGVEADLEVKVLSSKPT